MTGLVLQDLPVIAYWVWALVLAETTLIVLPLTIYFLRRALKTARRVQRDMKEMAEAGVRITQHSGSLSTSIGAIDMTALVQLAESLAKVPLQVEPTWTGMAHPGNGKNTGGVP
jgi:hypothetical protein